jgi:hypothetical protein
MYKKSIHTFKLVAGALAVLCSVLIYQLIKNYSNHQEFVTKSKIENIALQNQIDEILGKYDSLIAITEASAFTRTPISEDLSHSFESENADNTEKIHFLKSTIKNDKDEVVFLTNRIATHSIQLKKLSVVDKKTVIKKAQPLSAINVNAKGVKILSDLYASTSEKTIQQMRVCFTLEGNELISKGDKKVYIQVVNPKNQIISANNSSLTTEENVLIYSEEVTAFYNQKDTDVCTYVNLEKNKTVKGKYLVNIYADFKKIGTTTFEYN